MRKLVIAGLAAVVSAMLAPQAPAQSLGRVLHAITDPDEAHRYAEEAHRDRRPDEERYWQRYQAGLYEQRAHERGHSAEERYWHDYSSGLR
jgi:hypothetical protein